MESLQQRQSAEVNHASIQKLNVAVDTILHDYRSGTPASRREAIVKFELPKPESLGELKISRTRSARSKNYTYRLWFEQLVAKGDFRNEWLLEYVEYGEFARSVSDIIFTSRVEVLDLYNHKTTAFDYASASATTPYTAEHYQRHLQLLHAVHVAHAR